VEPQAPAVAGEHPLPRARAVTCKIGKVEPEGFGRMVGGRPHARRPEPFCHVRRAGGAVGGRGRTVFARNAVRRSLGKDAVKVE
jgi:hypothetical protein